MFANRLFNVFLAIALLMLIAITSIGFAASPNTEASGTFVTTSSKIYETEDKFNTIVDMRSAIQYSGTLEGTSTLEGTLVIRRDGSGTFYGVERFTGLVNGVPGTLTFKIEGNSDLYQAIRLNNTITGSTGGLANLQGVLTKVGMIKDNGPAGTYTGQINTTSNLNVEVDESDEY